MIGIRTKASAVARTNRSLTDTAAPWAASRRRWESRTEQSTSTAKR